jgi:hypothetical protein
VSEGQLSAAHYELERQGPNYRLCWPTWPANFDECPVVKLNKNQLYLEAKVTAPTRQRFQCWCCGSERTKEARRQQVAAKLEAQAWAKNKWHSDFAAQKGQDIPCYDEVALMDAEEARWSELSPCIWCCDQFSEDEYYPVHWDRDASPSPAETLDFNTLIDVALEKRNQAVRAEFEQLGWSEIGSDYAHSPEVDWADDVEEEFEEEFELI